MGTLVPADICWQGLASIYMRNYFDERCLKAFQTSFLARGHAHVNADKEKTHSSVSVRRHAERVREKLRVRRTRKSHRSEPATPPLSIPRPAQSPKHESQLARNQFSWTCAAAQRFAAAQYFVGVTGEKTDRLADS